MWLIKEARTEMNDQCCVTLFLRTTSVSPICLHVFPLPKSWAWNQFEKVDNHPSAISQDDPDFKYYILCVISMNGSEIPVFHHPNSLFCPGNRTKVYVRPQAPGFGKGSYMYPKNVGITRAWGLWMNGPLSRIVSQVWAGSSQGRESPHMSSASRHFGIGQPSETMAYAQPHTEHLSKCQPLIKPPGPSPHSPTKLSSPLEMTLWPDPCQI